ncbi:MAG: hypothetical protein V2A54_05480 [Bacteroidota bacterium]
MKSLISTIAIFISFTFQTAQAQEGNWTISKALTMDGKPYTGTVKISKLGDVWQIDWQTNEGNYQGLGIKKGNEIYAGWGGDKGFGVVVYQEKDGKLFGEWTFSNSKGMIGEEWIPASSFKNMEGSFTVTGKYPVKKGDYTGLISIVKNGDIYDVSWTTGKDIYYGIGILYEKYFVVGWSYDYGFGVIEYKFSGKKAKGKWSSTGRKTISFENLKKSK